MAQLALSCTEELSQSSSEEAPRKKVRFFSRVNTLTAQATKETSPAKATPQKQASSLIAAAGRPHPPTPFASPRTETITMSKIKVILISLAMLVALALAVVAAVKLLSDTSSEEIEVVEPYGELHQGPELFDFSNMKVAGSSTLIILGTLAAVSYFCRRRIISKLSRNQAPFVPSQPAAAAPAPAATYNQATGLALLPDINYQTLPQPFRGQVQDFCSFLQPQHATRLTPSFAQPSSRIPSSGDLDRLKLGLGLPPSYHTTAPLPTSYREATDMEEAMSSLDQNAARVALAQVTSAVGK